jgi:hypothetical protein
MDKYRYYIFIKENDVHVADTMLDTSSPLQIGEKIAMQAHGMPYPELEERGLNSDTSRFIVKIRELTRNVHMEQLQNERWIVDTTPVRFDAVADLIETI